MGSRPEIDLAQARTDRANARVQLINAENGYESAKAQLNLAMGYEGPTSYRVSSETLEPLAGEELSTDQLLDEALRQRPDVAAAESQLRAQQAALRAARGGFLPSLGLSAGASDTFPQSQSAFTNWSAGATLTWNLFSGGSSSAQVREAQANLDGPAPCGPR